MATDRQLKILQHLAVHDNVEVTDLGELLHVSSSTIRRELRAMEDNGLLVRTHGGAHLPSPIHYAIPYEKRAAQHVNEKRMIALAARKLVKPGTVIGIMGGTTCTELARVLRPLEHLTVVTNALNVALELQGPLSRRVVVTGGMLNQNSYELVGSQASQSLDSVHLDLAFLGVSGISLEYGFSMSDEPEAAVGRAFIAAADRAVVIADHSKIGQVTFARLCPLNSLGLLVTDKNTEPGQKKALEHVGLAVLIADGST
jgi:DeoR family transcriptional regulator of aga operon